MTAIQGNLTTGVTSPVPADQPGMAYDPVHGQDVFFGGCT